MIHLPRIFHSVSTKGAQSGAFTALCLFGRMVILSNSLLLPALCARLRPLATKPHEKSGLPQLCHIHARLRKFVTNLHMISGYISRKFFFISGYLFYFFLQSSWRMTFGETLNKCQYGRIAAFRGAGNLDCPVGCQGFRVSRAHYLPTGGRYIPRRRLTGVSLSNLLESGGDI